MPPKLIHILPLSIAKQCGSTQIINTLIGHDIPSLARQITPTSMSPPVLVEADIVEDVHCSSLFVNNDQNTLSDNQSDHNNNMPESNHPADDNVQPRVPSRIQLHSKVERQQMMIDFLFQHNT